MGGLSTSISPQDLHARIGTAAPLLVLAISEGLSNNFVNDFEMLGHGMVIYDALYAWCRRQTMGNA